VKYTLRLVKNKCIILILGQGTMALCTALSSSTFDVLICLGVPWFIKAMWFNNDNTSAFINVHSRSLDDSAIAVMLSTIGFMMLMCAKTFVLTKKVCIIFIFIYGLKSNNLNVLIGVLYVRGFFYKITLN
jgi:Ca2+/Na+ antiporter